MNYEEFQQAYESHSQNAFDGLAGESEDHLLEIISGQTSVGYNIWKGEDNYQIWRALGEIGTEKSIGLLFDIVNNLKNEYLIRYHACDALFKIAQITDNDLKGQVQYGLDSNRYKIDQSAAIERLRQILIIKPRAKTSKPWWKIG